jgi:hypothetical protein
MNRIDYSDSVSVSPWNLMRSSQPALVPDLSVGADIVTKFPDLNPPEVVCGRDVLDNYKLEKEERVKAINELICHFEDTREETRRRMLSGGAGRDISDLLQQGGWAWKWRPQAGKYCGMWDGPWSVVDVLDVGTCVSLAVDGGTVVECIENVRKAN